MHQGHPVRRSFSDKSTNGSLDHPSLSIVVLTQMAGFDTISSFQESGWTPRHLFGYLEKQIKLYSSDYQTNGITNFGFSNLQRVFVGSLEWIMRKCFLPTVLADGPNFIDFRLTRPADTAVCFIFCLVSNL